MKNLLVFTIFSITLGLSGCQKTYIQIKTEYVNSVLSNETKRIETDTKLYGTVRECASYLKDLLKFVNKELMDQRQK